MQPMSQQEQSQFNHRERGADDDADVVDLSQIARTIWRHRGAFLVAVVLALMSATVAYLLLPAKWRASATLQVGQMPANSAAHDVALIEPAAQFVEKFKLRDADILEQAGFPPAERAKQSARLLIDSMKASPVKNTALVRVSVSGYSAEEARRNINAAVGVVIAEHAALLAPTVQRLQQQLEKNAEQLEFAGADKKKVQAMLDKAGIAGAEPAFGPAILAMQLIENKNAELRRLTEERMMLEDLAGPNKTFATKIVGNIEVEGAPYFPNLKIFLVVGLFFGILVGAVFALCQEWRHSRRAPEPH